MSTVVNAAPRKILVVDDDDFFRLALAKALKRRGFETAEAASGDAALSLLTVADQKIDLILADVVMPGMNGVMLARQVESLYTGVKMLFISGYPFTTLEREYGLAKDQLPFFLQKPFGMEVLAAKVSEVLAEQGTRGPQ